MECIIRFNLKIHLIIKLSKVYITYVYLSINRSIVHHLISVYIDYKIVKNSLKLYNKTTVVCSWSHKHYYKNMWIWEDKRLYYCSFKIHLYVRCRKQDYFEGLLFLSSLDYCCFGMR